MHMTLSSSHFILLTHTHRTYLLAEFEYILILSEKKHMGLISAILYSHVNPRSVLKHAPLPIIYN